MWSSMTLRKRIAMLLGALLAGVFLATMAGLWIANEEDITAEREPFERQSAQVAASLNAVINASNNPDRVLNAFVASLETSSGAITFQTDRATNDVRRKMPRVPSWFLQLLPLQEHWSRSYPVEVGGRTLGYLTFFQDLYPDVYEKWLTFLTVVVIFLVFGTGSLVIIYFGLGTMLRPLGSLEEGLEAIGRGALPGAHIRHGPPEINRLIEKTNEIGVAMSGLRRENNELLRSMVALQDRERDEVSRDLHDELGPMLFGLRANAISLQQTASIEGCRNRAVEMENSIAALQGAHRQILDRLRPMEIREVGLTRSIAELVERSANVDPSLRISLNTQPGLDKAAEAVSRTVYRLVQEAILNIQRHSHATEAEVSVAVNPGTSGSDTILVSISDNGVGFPDDLSVGRGLSGMSERVKALGGKFALHRNATGARITCELPLAG
jgi:two-component system, NarL family, sensor histidine kinase UhpB